MSASPLLPLNTPQKTALTRMQQVGERVSLKLSLSEHAGGAAAGAIGAAGQSTWGTQPESPSRAIRPTYSVPVLSSEHFPGSDCHHMPLVPHGSAGQCCLTSMVAITNLHGNALSHDGDQAQCDALPPRGPLAVDQCCVLSMPTMKNLWCQKLPFTMYLT